MRVLHVDSGREMRGGQWQVLALVEGLRGAGVDGTLLARGPLLERGRAAGWDARPLGAGAVWKLARGADLVHAHDARSHTLAALLAARPLVVARRVAFPIGGGWKYRRAARYIAISEHVKQALIAGGVPEERITVVYDGVPALQFTRTGQRPVLLAPRTGDPMKGSDLAAAAAKLAGVPLEFSNDLRRDLPAAAGFVYITRSEGLGSAVLLAMAAGVPVIASNIGGLPEIIQDGVNGALVENRPEAIAAAMRRLLDDPGGAQLCAARARHTIEERFSLDLMVSHTLAVYRQVLA